MLFDVLGLGCDILVLILENFISIMWWNFILEYSSWKNGY